MNCSLRLLAPYGVLLAEVLVFYRKVLFSRFVIPWDFEIFHFTLASIVARSFRAWDLPLWDPYTYCGTPVFADLTAQAFYPPTVITVLLSNLAGGRKLLYFLEWQLALHVLAGGIFALLLLQRLGAGRAASLLGATIFQLGGFFASQTQHLGAVNAAAWMPLAWLALVSLGERFPWRWVAMLAFSLTMSFLAGFPAVTAVVFGSCLFLAVALILSRRMPVRLLAYLVLAYVWAGSLSAVQLLPTRELTQLSAAGLRIQWSGNGGGLPLQSLVSLVAPNHYGIFRFETYHLPWNLTFLYIYCGIPALVFGIAAAVFRRNKFATVFLVMAVLSAFWMLGNSTPVGRTALALLPGVVRAPMYTEFAMAAFVLAMAVLAGVGADPVLRNRRPALKAGVVVLAAADLIYWGSGRLMNTSPTKTPPSLTYEQMHGIRELPEHMRKLVNQTFPPSRIDVTDSSVIWSVGAPVIEVPSASGDDPFALLRFLQVRLLFGKGNYWERYYPVEKLDSPVLDLLNVRYILSGTTIEDEILRRASFRHVGELPGTQVYENLEVLPRFFLVGRIRRADDMKAALALLGSPGFDPGREAVVEGGVEFEGAAMAQTPVTVVKYTAREVVVETDSPSPAYLVTSEPFYPGWQAFVDGRPKPLHLTNVAFRGLPVPAGRHEVRMRFAPAILWRSAALSAAGWGLFFIVLLRR